MAEEKKKAVKKEENAAKKKEGKKRHTEEQKAELLKKYDELLKSGKNSQEAAKEVGVSYITILNWQKKKGRKPGKRGRKPGRKAGIKKVARKAVGGQFILKITGPDTQIERPIDEEIVSQIVKMIF